MTEKCNACQKKLGRGLFATSPVSDQVKTYIVDLGYAEQSWCIACARAVIDKHFEPSVLTEEKSILEEQCNLLTPSLSTKVNLHVSNECSGNNLGFITGYSALGTGFLTEFASTFTDTLGIQSESYRQKLSESEDTAKQDIIIKALRLGATAIYGVKYQITEATAGKGILISYFSGMAVQEAEPNEAFNEFVELMAKIKTNQEKLGKYNKVIRNL